MIHSPYGLVYFL